MPDRALKNRRVARAANNLQASSAGNSRLTVRPMTTDVVFTTQLRDPLLTGCQGGRASKTTRAELFRRLRMAETGVHPTLRMTLFDSMFHDRSQHSNTTRAHIGRLANQSRVNTQTITSRLGPTNHCVSKDNRVSQCLLLRETQCLLRRSCCRRAAEAAAQKQQHPLR